MQIITHKLSLAGSSNEFILLDEGREGEDCLLSCAHQGRLLSIKGPDFFTALCGIRLELEKEGLIPFCYGASLNVYPSNMARQMGQGKVGYKMQMGQPASRESLVRIFEAGGDVIPATVSQQQEYFLQWLASLK